jgi:hypothetical protein
MELTTDFIQNYLDYNTREQENADLVESWFDFGNEVEAKNDDPYAMLNDYMTENPFSGFVKTNRYGQKLIQKSNQNIFQNKYFFTVVQDSNACYY